MASLWVVGVLLSLTGSIILNVGVNVMKRAHTHYAKLQRRAAVVAAAAGGGGVEGEGEGDFASVSPRKLRMYLLQWRWWAGFALFAAGNTLDFLALGYAASSIIAPLGSVSLVMNALLAPRVNGERYTRLDAAATVLIILGAVLAVVFGNHEDEEYTLSELEAFAQSPPLLVYWAMVFLAVIGLVVVGELMRRRRCREEAARVRLAEELHREEEEEATVRSVRLASDSWLPAHRTGTSDWGDELTGVTWLGSDADDSGNASYDYAYEYETASDASSAAASSSSSSARVADDGGSMAEPLSPPIGPHSRQLYLAPFVHVLIGGMVGGQTTIGAKMTSELLNSWLRGRTHELESPWPWLIALLTGLTGLVQIHQFQLALRLADALFVVPNYYVVWTTFSLIGSALFFREFSSFSVHQAILFPAGVLITFSGVYLLLGKLRKTDEAAVAHEVEEMVEEMHEVHHHSKSHSVENLAAHQS